MIVDTDRVMALTKAQAEVLADLHSKMIVFVAGMGAGKTRTAAMKAIELAQANAPIPILYVMPTIPMLIDVALPELFSVLDDMGFVDGEDYVHNKQRRVLTIHFEEGIGKIWLRSSENPRRLVGPSVAGAIIDEAEDNREEAVKIVRSRVRHPKAKHKQICAFGTPESLGGWFYREAEGDRQPTTNVIRARTADNFFLDEDYIADAARYWTKEEQELYLEGKFVARRGRVYTQFRDADHVRPFIDGMAGQYVMGCDFGRGCMSWVFGQVVDDILYIFGEQVLEGSDTIEASKRARTWWAAYMRDTLGVTMTDEGAAESVTAYVDPAGEMKGSISDVRVLREHGFRVLHHHQHPRIKDRVMAVQEKFAKFELFVDGERAPYTVRCLQGQSYDKNGFPEKGRPRDGKKAFDHAVDALGYLVQYRWPASLGHAKIVGFYG